MPIPQEKNFCGMGILAVLAILQEVYCQNLFLWAEGDRGEGYDPEG